MINDRCTGGCCKSFCLSVTWSDMIEDFGEWKAGHRQRYRGTWLLAQILKPLGKHKVNPETSHVYSEPVELFSCTMLQVNGDCGIYDARPNMCRDYPHGRPCANPHCTWEQARGWASPEGIYASEVSA